MLVTPKLHEFQGTAAAYSQLTTEFSYVTYNLTGVVHPDFRGQALGSFLAQWAEKCAEQTVAKADPAIFNRDYFNSSGLCFVVLEGDEVVGSCLCNAKTVEFPEAGYLGSLSVRRPWRRRGVGLALTYQALNAFYQRGTRTVLTDTDGDSFTQAYDLYQKAGMIIYRQENVYEKEIRPGHDLIKRQME